MINSIKDNLPSIPEKNIKDFIDQIINSAVEGKGPLAGAEELAQGYLADSSYSSLHEMSVSLIRREASKNFGSGFITGLGGSYPAGDNTCFSLLLMGSAGANGRGNCPNI